MTDPVMIAMITGITTGIPAAILALATLLQSRSNKKNIADNTALTAQSAAVTKIALKAQDVKLDVVHTLVNDLSTQSLRQLSEKDQRIAELTKLPQDILAAKASKDKYDTKVETDRAANAQTAEGHAAAAAEREKESK